MYSDKNPLVYFRKQIKPTPRLIRWIAELEMYAPIIKYKPGAQNTAADALSRIPTSFVDTRSVALFQDNQEPMEPQYLYSIWDKHSPEFREDWPLLYIGNQVSKVKDTDLKKA